MSEQALHLALWTREFLKRSGDVSNHYDQDIVATYIGEHDKQISEYLKIITQEEFDELCKQTLYDIQNLEYPLADDALDESTALFQTANEQHVDLAETFFIMAGMTAVLGVVVMGIIIVARIKSIKSANTEVVFQDGLPSGLKDIVNTVAGPSSALAKILDKPTGDQ